MKSNMNFSMLNKHKTHKTDILLLVFLLVFSVLYIVFVISPSNQANEDIITDEIILTTENIEIKIEPEIESDLVDQTPEPEDIVSENIINESTLNRWEVNLTAEEIELLEKIVFLEAGNQCDEGQMAVAETVLNRIVSDKYPDTLYEVVSQKGQFGSFNKINNAEVTGRVQKNVRSVLYGESNILDQEYLYFSTVPITENMIVKIEDHYFSQ